MGTKNLLDDYPEIAASEAKGNQLKTRLSEVESKIRAEYAARGASNGGNNRDRAAALVDNPDVKISELDKLSQIDDTQLAALLEERSVLSTAIGIYETRETELRCRAAAQASKAALPEYKKLAGAVVAAAIALNEAQQAEEKFRGDLQAAGLFHSGVILPAVFTHSVSNDDISGKLCRFVQFAFEQDYLSLEELRRSGLPTEMVDYIITQVKGPSYLEVVGKTSRGIVESGKRAVRELASAVGSLL